MSSDTLRDLVLHMEWADATLWQSVLEHADGPLDAKVEETLHHIHMVQHAFTMLWRGEVSEEVPTFPQPAEFAEPPALARWGREAHAEVQRYLAGADETDLRRELAIPWTEHIERQWGRPMTGTVSVEQSAFQVALHSTHHRGQVAARLREVGGEPPLVDFIGWLWFDKPDAAWPPAVAQ